MLVVSKGIINELRFNCAGCTKCQDHWYGNGKYIIHNPTCNYNVAAQNNDGTYLL